MSIYKILFDGEELCDEFQSEEDAEEMAIYYQGCDRLGREMLHMSNPGDYEYDEETYESPDFEIIEIEE